MGMPDCKVTVLMPAYNAEKYIGEAISSVLDQTFSDFELLIVNDGSTDGTEQVILSFTDPRIVLINRKNGGVSAALNSGLQMARGMYIARFDADDICYSDRLAVQVAFMENNPDHILCGSDVDYITEEGGFIYHHHCSGYSSADVFEKFYFYCPFIHSSVIFKRDEVLQAGGYNVLAHTFEDYFLWVQLLAKGKLANIPKALIKVRLNAASVTIDEKWRGHRFRALRRNIIKNGSVSEKQSEQLLAIIKKQDVQRVKHGAYYALCAKKFLTDNYQPLKARRYAILAIREHPFRWDNYALFFACYFSQKSIQWLHGLSPNRL
jgi:glycosyltransferase involved in cell wall biosynthesis